MKILTLILGLDHIYWCQYKELPVGNCNKFYFTKEVRVQMFLKIWEVLTDYFGLFTIYSISQIQILMNPKIFKLDWI